MCVKTWPVQKSYKLKFCISFVLCSILAWTTNSCKGFVHCQPTIVVTKYLTVFLLNQWKHITNFLCFCENFDRSWGFLITVEYSPNHSNVYIKLCKYRKKKYYFYELTFPSIKKRKTLCHGSYFEKNSQ